MSEFFKFTICFNQAVRLSTGISSILIHSVSLKWEALGPSAKKAKNVRSGSQNLVGSSSFSLISYEGQTIYMYIVF